MVNEAKPTLYCRFFGGLPGKHSQKFVEDESKLNNKVVFEKASKK
jgi:hypothetical protein